jgi:hypothetical protein
MKSYWKNFGIGSVALLSIFLIGGWIHDRSGGDAIGALAEIWVYIIFAGLVYSLLARPWRKAQQKGK